MVRDLSPSLASPSDEMLDWICIFCASVLLLAQTALYWCCYLFDIVTRFCACLYVEDSTNLLEILLGLLGTHFAVEFKVRFCSYQEENSLLMSILSSLPYPSFKIVEAILAVDGECKKDPADSFIERSHDSSEGFLSSLDNDIDTVSHICSLTWSFSSIMMVLDVNSTPTVTLYWSVNYPLMYLVSIAVFPTPGWYMVYLDAQARWP